MMARLWPRACRLWASVEPTRPHPMITMCTLILRRVPAHNAYGWDATPLMAAMRPGGRVRPYASGCGQPHLGPQATSGRPTVPLGPVAAHAPSEAHRPPGLRLRPALQRGLRARRNPADAVHRGRVRLRV